ncbi:MAG: cupin-like domain-containing protein [Roseiarcus sp.]
MDRLTPDEFFEHFVRPRRPLVISGGMKNCAAFSQWSLDYLHHCSGDRIVPLKIWDSTGIRIEETRLGKYIDDLRDYASKGEDAAQRPAYLHDVPLTSIVADASSDLEALPVYFPAWYGALWPRFAQLFLGPSGSVTPLHFDCLLTHNLFFQVVGEKRFTLIPREQSEYCYRNNWRWFEVDVEQPDYGRHPLYRFATPAQVVVGPGDILYLPPGTLHHVRSLTCALSFNVDWHTRDSALIGLIAGVRGMPRKNVYYNAVIAFGLWGGASAKALLPHYRSYLNYVS